MLQRLLGLVTFAEQHSIYLMLRLVLMLTFDDHLQACVLKRTCLM